MLGKLATLIAVFTLALSTAAFASPADARDFAGETEVGGDFDRADLVGGHDQDEIEEVQVQLYLGPVDSQEEIITDADDRRVN